MRRQKTSAYSQNVHQTSFFKIQYSKRKSSTPPFFAINNTMNLPTKPKITRLDIRKRARPKTSVSSDIETKYFEIG